MGEIRNQHIPLRFQGGVARLRRAGVVTKMPRSHLIMTVRAAHAPFFHSDSTLNIFTTNSPISRCCVSATNRLYTRLQ